MKNISKNYKNFINLQDFNEKEILIKLKIKRWKEILFDFEFKIHIQNFLCHYNKTPTEFLLLKLAKKYTSKERIQKEDSVLKIKKKNKK